MLGREERMLDRKTLCFCVQDTRILLAVPPVDSAATAEPLCQAMHARAVHCLVLTREAEGPAGCHFLTHPWKDPLIFSKPCVLLDLSFMAE